MNKEGQMVPFPIENETEVEIRRKEYGLEPLSEYKKQLQEMFKSQKK